MIEAPQLYIGEVGCSSEHFSISGISADTTQVDCPRLVILEPENDYCVYKGPNDHTRFLFESCGQKFVYGDIYREFNITDGKFGLLFLENVINDPLYSERKDFGQLSTNCKKVVAVNGLVLFNVSIFPERHVDKYVEVKKALENKKFSVEFDDITNFNERLSDIEIRQRKTKIMHSIELTGFSDSNLITGIKTRLDSPMSYWMLLRN